MSLKIACVQAAVPTSTGDQTITTTKCGGLTPKLAIFMITGWTANDVNRNNSQWCFGAAVSSSKRFVLGSYATNNLSSTTQDSMRYKDNAHCAVSYQGGAGATYDGIADFVSFTTNGCTINWSNAPGNAYLMTVIFFCGTDLSVDISTLTLNSTVNGTATESGLSFTPDVLIPVMSGFTQWATGGDYWNMQGIGLVKNGGNKNALLANVPFYSYECQSKGRLTTSYGAGFSTFNTSGDVRVGVEFGSFSSTGYTATTRVNNCDATTDIKVICLNFGTRESYVGTFSSKTSTGTQAYTGVGFKPQALLGWFTDMTALDSSDTGHGHGFYCADNNKDTLINCWNSGDRGASNSQEKCYTNSSITCHDAEDETKYVQATLSSYDSDGFTWDYSVANGTARYGTYLAIEEDAATLYDDHSVGRGANRGISRGIG
jgi:hypothetical protein